MLTAWPTLFRPREGRRYHDRTLLERVRCPRAYPSKAAIGRWSGATFRDDYRSLASFEAATWLVLDFDRKASRELVVEVFGELRGIGHTTWTPGRWRVALLVDRPLVSVEEHDRVWRAAAIHSERRGLEADTAARDAAHCFAVSGSRRSGSGSGWRRRDELEGDADVEERAAELEEVVGGPATRREGLRRYLPRQERL